MEHTRKDDNNIIKAMQEVQRTTDKEKKEMVSLRHMYSDIETATVQELPLMTTDKPWYTIELINIHKKEHIVDPKDYSMLKKSSILAIIAISAAMNPFSSSIYYPAMVDMQVELDTTDTAINASLSSFTFVTAFFPLLWASLSERLGRRPIYLMSFFICIVGNICCALSGNITMFIVFQAISAIGCSSIAALGAGTIVDVFEPKQRGRAFSYYSSGVLLGPALSPIVGGYLNQGFGWKSIFWFLSILAFCIWLVILLILPETQKLSFMESKRTKLENEYNDYNEEKVDFSKTSINSSQKKKELKLSALLGPLQFFRFPNVIFSTAYIGVLFFTCFIINANFTRIYTKQYKFASGTVGLCYVGLAVGSIVGCLITGRISDAAYRKQVAGIKNKEEIQAEMRLTTPIFYASIILSIISFVVFGWCIQADIHYAAGLVCMFFLGLSLIIPNIIVTVYFMDCFSRHSTAATACNNMVRYVMAGIGSLIASDFEKALGPGILYTICGAIILLASGNIIILRMNGKKWATKRKEAGF